MVKVKICGITQLEDAVVALEAGADYLGFVLYPPSPRAVTREYLARLSTELRLLPRTRDAFTRPIPPLLVGVFVNDPAEKTAEILDSCNLDLAQLSGDEEPEQITDPASPLFGRAYKALRPRSMAEDHDLSFRYTNCQMARDFPVPRLLLDTPHGTLYGGTGETGDWAIAGRLAARVPGLMLAGGLTLDNVGNAVRSVRPFAVDVSGGVEVSPGRKDPTLVRSFIANAKLG